MSFSLARWLGNALAIFLALGASAGNTFLAAPPAPAGCLAETEPNDRPENGMPMAGAFCVEGRIGADDQDIFTWEVGAADAAHGWTVTLEGLPDQQSKLELHRIDEPARDGKPPSLSSTLWSLIASAGAPTASDDALFVAPGQYLLGLSVSGGQGSYRIRFAPAPAPERKETEPNDVSDRATPVSGAFEISGDQAGSEDWFAWTIGDDDALQRFTVTLDGALGFARTLDLLDPTGAVLLHVWDSGSGRISLDDLGLAAGTYRLHLSPAAPTTSAYVLRARAEGPRIATREDEPNDTMARATPIRVGRAMGGRLGRRGDVDVFAFRIDPASAAARLEIALATGARDRRVCLLAADGHELQCRDGVAPKLVGLVLAPGTYGIAVSGQADPAAPYSLTVRRAAPPPADVEHEPNDEQATAMALGQERRVRGHLTGLERDMFRVTIEGQPQLWTVRVDGRGVKELDVVGAQGLREASRLWMGKGDRLEIAQLFLLPGDHWLTVEGTDADYQLSLEPTGPPDPNGEREPNDTEDRAQPLAFGMTRTGVVSESNDTDMYRFSLATTEHLALRVEPPAGQDLGVRILWQSPEFGRPGTQTRGAPVTWDAVLPPGDYYVTLYAQEAATSPYRLTLERRNPLDVPTGVEPSNTPSWATELPDTLSVRDVVGVWSNDHWYRLPALGERSGVTIRTTGQVSVRLVRGSDFLGNDEIPLTTGKDSIAHAELPAGIGTLMCISTIRGGPTPYTADVSFTRGPAPRPKPAELPVTLSVALGTPRVAAYWIRGQRIDGTVTLANDGAEPLDLTLATRATSRHLTPALARPEVHLDPHGKVSVPIEVAVAPDAFADPGHLVSVRASAADGAALSATATLAIDPNAPPVDERVSFALPEPMVGGFDVASAALGGNVVAPPGDPGVADQALLFDGLLSTYPFKVPADKLPATVTVAFGGDRPWPIAGFLLDPGAAGAEALGDFEMLLSEDGSQFTSVLTGTLRPDDAEQAFALPAPRPARAAQLKLKGNHAGSFGSVKLAEWKVVTSGGEPAGTSLDLADPSRGGHVVWSRPLIGAEPATPKSMLVAGGPSPVVALAKGESAEWVVGFRDDRAAQLVSLEWHEEPPLNQATPLGAVEVSLSTESALGPWKPLGTWKLDRKGGSIAPWKLGEPVWARFVRFVSTPAASEAGKWQLPAQLRIMERPIGADYRSILGEWGRYEKDAGYEKEKGVPRPALRESDHNDSRAEAQSLPLDAEVAGDVLVNSDEDWYAIDFPGGAANTLVLRVGGEPSVDVEVAVQDESGQEVALRNAGSAPREQVFEADLAGPKRLFMKVSEPPHSVVIAYDTSGSLMGQTPIVFDGLARFATGVTPGAEAVNFMPFEQPLMLPAFSDQPFVLQAALAADPRGSTSSGSEPTLIAASQALAERRGPRAILLLTDASTPSYNETATLWDRLATVHPRIFTAHIGAWDDPEREKTLMQDWAMAYAGHYAYCPARAEMDVAFERVAAWLRRPARYRLQASAVTKAPPAPGAIQVAAGTPEAPGKGTSTAAPREGAAASARGAVELIFDASGSMLQKFEGKRRIDVAHQVLTELVTRTLPSGVPLALRAFGNDKPGSCESHLVRALAPLDPAEAAKAVAGIQSVNRARTALGASLRAVRDDLAEAKGPRTVIVVTDGEETCGGDPRREIDALVADGYDVHVNIVGFAVDDAKLKDTFRDWARAGRGQYFDAQSSQELSTALTAAVSPPASFKVVGPGGTVVATGVVGGDPVSVAPGVYRVEIEGAAPTQLEGVVVGEGRTTRVGAPAAR